MQTVGRWVAQSVQVETTGTVFVAVVFGWSVPVFSRTISIVTVPIRPLTKLFYYSTNTALHKNVELILI